MRDYKYILYVKKDCSFCVRAENFLKLKDIHYKSIYFDQNLKILEHLKDAYGWTTVPMIFEKEEDDYIFVGGYTDLVKKQESDERI